MPTNPEQNASSGPRPRRATGLLVVAIMAAACATSNATPSPSAAPSTPVATPSELAPPTEPASPGASASPAAVASPAEQPSTAASPATPVPLTVRWHPKDLTGIGPVDGINAVARAGDTYVLVGSMPYVDETSPNSAVWWSSDGSSWTLAQQFPPSDRVLTLVSGGPGFVAGGTHNDDAAVWTSTDGRTWAPVSDPSLTNGVLSQLVTTDGGLVGFGWRSDNQSPRIWTSSDGVGWLAATNDSGMTVAKGLEAVGSYGGRAIAFVSAGDKRPPSIWETTGRAEWTRTGTLPDVAPIDRVAGGTRGWVALGANRAWTSADGKTWSKGVPGPDVDMDVIVDDAGYVAVGYVGSLPGETCGDQRPFAGHTWTSADGRTWQRMPVTKAFRSAMVTKLLAVDRTLLGYGQQISGDGSGDGFPVAEWSDTLPPLTAAGGASDKASVPKTCGP